ncbi:class I SAM-dependent methyltransferase [Nocardiopsis sp. RSe5-2]|uniref:Class I SAM-dependent methyltransferase n=1 Tax=Nocardiopsis endophytica TaxID=3018445 RepID=A0ABT4U2E0_9ACTN|nr:class I SAM-dependent methyltransferase [Nocardiopsis endophytica]MDA2811119.1 class I SAM-dependent methyltransferase [Nocardiopsis endophytica]
MADERSEASTQHLTALAAPDALIDWRLALCYETAHTTGILDALPGAPARVAEATGLDEQAVTDVLHVLAAWDHLSIDGTGTFTPGGAWPSGPERLALAGHGTWIRRWATTLPARIHDRTATADGAGAPGGPDPATGLALLESATRPYVARVVEACLDRVPAEPGRPLRVLDLGGGHGAYAREFARRGCATTLQDLPAVIDILAADGRTAAAGVELHGGDAFTDLAPGPYDLVLCGIFTNMFGLDRVRDLLARVTGILVPGGRIAIATWMRDLGPVGAAFGIQMLVATTEGDAHPSGAYRRLLAETGYAGIGVAEVADPPLAVMTAENGAWDAA